jgi:hypothetical protein
LRLRVRWLRRNGTEATATVTKFASKYVVGGRGGSLTYYTVHVSWHGTEHERRFRFWGRGSPTFERICARRRAVTVRFTQRHPDRFVLDIPYAPTMADLIR